MGDDEYFVKIMKQLQLISLRYTAYESVGLPYIDKTILYYRFSSVSIHVH